MNIQEDPDLYDLDAPPLFCPNVFVPERGEKLTFGPKGYMMRLSRFMVSDYDTVRPILAIAKKYNIKVTWKRVLEVFVHEAHDLEKQVGLSIHDVRCKVKVADQIKRTRLVDYDKDLTSVWNESLKFHVGEPSSIDILVYCKNNIIPNDKLGRISILPIELVERNTITEWFSFNTKGEIKLSISLSPPALAPFKFSLNFAKLAHEWHILDAVGDKMFTILGQWPYALTICDSNAANIETVKIQNLVYKSHEKEFDVKYEEDKKFTILNREEHEFDIRGLVGVEQIKSSPTEFALYSPAQICIGSAKPELINRNFVKYAIEVRPGKDLLLILIAMFLVAKLRHFAH